MSKDLPRPQKEARKGRISEASRGAKAAAEAAKAAKASGPLPGLGARTPHPRTGERNVPGHSQR